MRMPTFAALTFAAATLLGTSAALAGPLPAGGGAIQTAEASYEALVQNRGDILSGISSVDAIHGSTSTWTSGQGGVWLSSVFNNFVLQNIKQTIINPTTTAFELAFSGGSLQYFSSGSDPFAGGALQQAPQTQAGAISAIETGGLWLDLKPEVIANMAVTGAADGSGALNDGNITLIIDFTASDIASFSGAATQQVYLDIVGGSAANAFVQNTIKNTFIMANGPADGSFRGTADSNCFNAPIWQVCGTNKLDATVIPEPITLSLFGAGLAGAAAIRRRKAKKA